MKKKRQGWQAKTFEFDPVLIKRFDDLCTVTGWSQIGLLRRAVNEYYEENYITLRSALRARKAK